MLRDLPFLCFLRFVNFFFRSFGIAWIQNVINFCAIACVTIMVIFDIFLCFRSLWKFLIEKNSCKKCHISRTARLTVKSKQFFRKLLIFWSQLKPEFSVSWTKMQLQRSCILTKYSMFWLFLLWERWTMLLLGTENNIIDKEYSFEFFVVYSSTII